MRTGETDLGEIIPEFGFYFCSSSISLMIFLVVSSETGKPKFSVALLIVTAAPRSCRSILPFLLARAAITLR